MSQEEGLKKFRNFLQGTLSFSEPFLVERVQRKAVEAVEKTRKEYGYDINTLRKDFIYEIHDGKAKILKKWQTLPIKSYSHLVYDFFKKDDLTYGILRRMKETCSFNKNVPVDAVWKRLQGKISERNARSLRVSSDSAAYHSHLEKMVGFCSESIMEPEVLKLRSSALITFPSREDCHKGYENLTTCFEKFPGIKIDYVYGIDGDYKNLLSWYRKSQVNCRNLLVLGLVDSSDPDVLRFLWAQFPLASSITICAILNLASIYFDSEEGALKYFFGDPIQHNNRQLSVVYAPFGFVDTMTKDVDISFKSKVGKKRKLNIGNERKLTSLTCRPTQNSKGNQPSFKRRRIHSPPPIVEIFSSSDDSDIEVLDDKSFKPSPAAESKFIPIKCDSTSVAQGNCQELNMDPVKENLSPVTVKAMEQGHKNDNQGSETNGCAVSWDPFILERKLSAERTPIEEMEDMKKYLRRKFASGTKDPRIANTLASFICQTWLRLEWTLLDLQWSYAYHQYELGWFGKNLIDQLNLRLKGESLPGNLDSIMMTELTLDFLGQNKLVQNLMCVDYDCLKEL